MIFWKNHLFICKTWYRLHKMLDRYDRSGRPPPSSRIRTPADPCLSLYYFEISIFGDGRKTFSKAPLAPIVRGDRAPKKRDFLVNAFWPLFLKFCVRHRKIVQTRVFLIVWESSENQIGRPKKRSAKLSKIF